MARLWGDEELIFEDEEQINTVLAAVAIHYNTLLVVVHAGRIDQNISDYGRRPERRTSLRDIPNSNRGCRHA